MTRRGCHLLLNWNSLLLRLGTAEPCSSLLCKRCQPTVEKVGQRVPGVLRAPGCRPPSVTRASEQLQRPAPCFLTQPSVSVPVPSAGGWGQGAVLGSD